MKKLTAILLAVALVPMAAFSPAASAATAIKVEYNQKSIVFPDQKPILQNNRTLVPIRPIAESLGFDVDWNEETRTVLIKKGDDQVRLVVSQKIARKNGVTVKLDVPAQIVNQRTMVPVRFIAEALEYEVNWDQQAQAVLIADQATDAKVDDPKEQPQEQKPEAPKAPIETDEVIVDSESITAKSANLMGLGVYSITGKTDPDSELTVTLDDKDFDVKVESDGSFKFELMDKIIVDYYKMTATKDGEEQIVEGVFTKRN
ncbi:BBRPI [Mycobacterium tuberculosis]|nr:BBRPI [Mycobacterium tuberculosis]